MHRVRLGVLAGPASRDFLNIFPGITSVTGGVGDSFYPDVAALVPNEDIPFSPRFQEGEDSEEPVDPVRPEHEHIRTGTNPHDTTSTAGRVLIRTAMIQLQIQL